MIIQYKKLNLVIFLSIFFSFMVLFVNELDSWVGSFFEILPLPIILIVPIIPGFVFGLLIQNYKIDGYIKEAFWYSLIFGFIYGIMNISAITYLDKDDIVIEDGVLSIIGGVLFAVGLFSFIGFTFSFFGSLIAVIPKYFASLGVRK